MKPPAEAGPPELIPALAALWQGHRRSCVAALVVIAAGVLAAFSGSLDNEFVNWDDDVYILANPALRRIDVGLLTLRQPNWHPVTWLVHALDLGLFGPEATGHHLTSLVWHAANAVLVGVLGLAIALCLRRPEPPWALVAGATVAALLFAVHPLRVESVAWASEKKDVVFAFFSLLTLLCWLAHAGSAGPDRPRLYRASIVFTALAVLSKSMAVTLPALLLLLDAYPLRRLGLASLPDRLREKLPHLVLSGIGIAAVLGRSGVPAPFPNVRIGGFLPTDRIFVPIRGLGLLLEKLVVPEGLVPFYPLPPPALRRLDSPQLLFPTLLLLAIAAAAVWAFRRGWRAPLAAWAGFLIAIAPASGIQPLSGELTADRYSYLPMVAFALLAGALATTLAAHPRWRVALVVPSLAVVALVPVTRRQVEVWRDSETLWTTVASAFPGQVVMAHNNLGAIHHERARRTHDRAELQRAAAEYRRALEIFPDHPNALSNLGLVAKDEGDWMSAERLFRAALAIAPNHPVARANLALLYFESGEVEKAGAMAEQARALGLRAPELDRILEQAARATPPPLLFPEEEPSASPTP